MKDFHPQAFSEDVCQRLTLWSVEKVEWKYLCIFIYLHTAQDMYITVNIVSNVI